MQRCLEHGNTEQIEAIALQLQGNILKLSKDAFGCHVVQKALDNIPEKYKALYVEEMLTDIKQTVTHRYACHVWQKFLELKWTTYASPNIMLHINTELQGLWVQIAMGETGSLMVQNIFENCIEVEQLPCLAEIMNDIPAIIRGQWGNWVVQHVGRAPSRQIEANCVDFAERQRQRSRKNPRYYHEPCSRIFCGPICFQGHRKSDQIERS